MSRPSVTPSGWHLAALSSLAVSHPIATVLVQGPEFFVAHDLDGTGLVLLAAGLFAGVPLAVWMATAFTKRLHPGAGRLVAMTLLVGLVTLIAVQGLKRAGIDSQLTTALAGLAGLLGLGLYTWFAAARLFVSALVPAPIVAALVFFMSPPVAALVRPAETPAVGAGTDHAPPVVIVVFDQLPLLSLLDERRQIDRRRFPNFAAFADVSTWYRNTTAVATLTNWAMPALLTGRYPQRDLLPAAVHHPGSLFSILAATHRFHVVEPITALCPARLCPGPGGTAWMSLASDLAVVYGHIALPETLTARLPPVTHNWRGFGFDFWQRRWSDRRDDDRRQAALDWIEGIDPSPEPVLHLLHVLLPHEPYIYLPTGQVGALAGDLAGLGAYEAWGNDRRLVSLAYQRHLLQVQFVDRLLGLTLDRLRQVGLFDDALIAVVADHGAAFRPGRPFKQPVDSTLAEIGAIPFLIKSPASRAAQIDDQPLQSIDILPTIAEALRAEVSWEIDGRAAHDAAAQVPDVRRLYRDRAERYVTFSNEQFEQSMQAGERRKREAVDSDPAVPGWPGDPVRHLIGTAVTTLDVAEDPVIAASIDNIDAFAIVDPAGPYVPAYVSGVARALDGMSSVQVPLAIAVNGVIRATTEPGREPVAGRPNFWAALVAPDAFRTGANDITMFEVMSTNPPRLRTVALAGGQDGPPNLLDRSVQAALGISERGFHAMEANESTTYRWTDGRASLTIPVDTRQPPRELELRTFMASDAGRTLEIRVNECVLFDGPAADPPTRRLSLAPCGPLGNTATITFISESVVPGPGDTRRLGIALQSVRLR